MFKKIKLQSALGQIPARMRRFAKHCEGVAALEFALLAPIFFAMTFALIEMLVFMLGTMSIEDATKKIEIAMHDDRNAGNEFNLDTYRTILCNNVTGVFISDCDAENVKIRLWYAGRQLNGKLSYNEQPAFPIKNGIDNSAKTTWADVWIIGVQLEWPYVLPTTRLLNIMPNVNVEETKPMIATVRTAVISRELVAKPSSK